MTAVLEIPAAQQPARRCAVALHGLGASGANLAPIAPLLDPAAHWLLPDAPEREVTINMGMRMPAWYDVKQADLEQDEDAEGFAASAALVAELLQRRTAELELDPAETLLLGFSQGAALALHLALLGQVPLRAVIAFSGYIPLQDQLPPDAAWPQAVLFFLGAGAEDQVIPAARSLASAELLREHGCAAHYSEYPTLAHGIEPQEVADARAFLDAAGV